MKSSENPADGEFVEEKYSYNASSAANKCKRSGKKRKRRNCGKRPQMKVGPENIDCKAAI